MHHPTERRRNGQDRKNVLYVASLKPQIISYSNAPLLYSFGIFKEIVWAGKFPRFAVTLYLEILWKDVEEKSRR
jgi:hypothetical protein